MAIIIKKNGSKVMTTIHLRQVFIISHQIGYEKSHSQKVPMASPVRKLNTKAEAIRVRCLILYLHILQVQEL